MAVQRVENDTNGWVEIPLGTLRSKDGTEPPFRLIANRFKSSSDDCEAFIHNPRQAFIDASRDVPALQGVDSSWRVATFIVNHHETLSWTHVWTLATVNPNDAEIGVTIVKKP